MRRWWLIIAALLAFGCASGPDVVRVQLPEPNLDGVIRLIGKFTRAHACPFGDGKFAFTAAHVVDLRPFDLQVPYFGARWSDGRGNSGTVVPVPQFIGQDMDLAVIQRRDGKPFPQPYPLADIPPEPGERIYILGYDDSSRRNALAPKITRGRVIRRVADNLVLDEDSKPGSSGGCVLNEQGEIVAIVAWGSAMPDGKVGIAPGVWASIETIRTLQAALKSFRPGC